MPCQIYLCCCHADDWSGNQRNLQRHCVQGGYERQTHSIVPASLGAGVEDIGELNREVVF